MGRQRVPRKEHRDAELIRLLDEGMNYSEIARRWRVTPQRVGFMARRLIKEGRL